MELVRNTDSQEDPTPRYSDTAHLGWGLYISIPGEADVLILEKITGQDLSFSDLSNAWIQLGLLIIVLKSKRRQFFFF